MALYELTYTNDSDGGNVQYQTTKQVEKEAATADVPNPLVTTGLSIEEGRIVGTAVVELDEDVVPTTVFESPATVHPIDGDDSLSTPETRDVDDQTAPVISKARLSSFEASDGTTALLRDVTETPGRGGLLSSDLTPYRPHEHDVWLVPKHSTVLDAAGGLSIEDVLEFYDANHDLLARDPSHTLGVYHDASDTRITITIVATMPSPPDGNASPMPVTSPKSLNVHRFELGKAPLVVGEPTHGPGRVDAVFRSSDGEIVQSRDLAFQRLFEDVDVYFHPLGVLVDGELYRPVIAEGSDAPMEAVGEPIVLESYRGGTGKPWQFGVTRDDDQIFLTQARAGPEKFDPVIKRFPIETQSIGAEPLVFSYTVSRRNWTEDPQNLHVRSQRNQGLRTQFLYEDGEGWHLIQPKALGEPTDADDSSFEPTALDGVTVRSSLLRSETDGETKVTVEHEYRVTRNVFSACDRLYALSYHEVDEESIDTLQWEIANATAHEITPEKSATNVN